jgi:hypothetical protein
LWGQPQGLRARAAGHWQGSVILAAPWSEDRTIAAKDSMPQVIGQVSVAVRDYDEALRFAFQVAVFVGRERKSVHP